MNLIDFAWRDFKSQKVKSIFGIGGVAISILLVSTVGLLIDSLSFSYLDASTAEAGSADISISRTTNFDVNFDPYFDYDSIASKLDFEEIEALYPRIMMLVDVQEQVKMPESKRLIFYGIDSYKEYQTRHMGDLYYCDPVNLEKTDKIFMGPIKEGYCLVLQTTARKNNLTEGDVLTLTYTRYTINLTIEAVVYQELRFSSAETNMVITELEQAQSFLHEDGKINYLMATLNNRQYIYDTRDIDGTTKKIREIGTKIQKAIGFDYMISLPKMQMLSSSQMITVMMQMMLFFVTILASLISGILINSILTTSIEERIREFGVMRVLGGRKSLSVFLVLFQGIFIGLFGTLIGIVGSLLAVPILLDLLYNLVDFITKPIPFIILPQTLLTNFLIGLVISVIISLFPALKAGKVQITEAIDPFRKSHENEFYLAKEGSPNTRIIIIGISISTIGLLIFIMFPRILVTQNMSLVLGLFIGLLLAILIGLVMAFVGLVPVFEMIILMVFKPFIKKYHSIVKLSLQRNVRRNTGNVIMFSLAFAFIFYMSSIIVVRHDMITRTMEFQYGSDLVISNQGSPENGDEVDLEFFEKISQSPMIKSAAPVVQNTFDVSELIGTVFTAIEDDIDFETLAPAFRRAFSNPGYDTYIGSITAYNNVDCGLVGIDQNYVDLIPENQFIWDRSTGSGMQCFNSLFDDSRNDTVIISKSLADYIGITELGQKVRLTFAADGQDEFTGNATTMTVVGVSGGMPGFWNFRSSSYSIWNGGVMMSMKNYLAWMNQGDVNDSSTPINKIMINLETTTERSIEDTKNLIKDLYGEDYTFLVDDNISKIKLMTQNDATIDIIMEIILMLTVIISLFGLISTMYSTLIERMYEIGLMRSMGLRTSNVRGIFIAESVIMVLASGLMGMFIGSFIAYLMADNVSILTEIPPVFTISIDTMIRTFSLSIAICIIGVILITRRVKKWSIMEIFRSTF